MKKINKTLAILVTVLFALLFLLVKKDTNAIVCIMINKDILCAPKCRITKKENVQKRKVPAKKNLYLLKKRVLLKTKTVLIS